MARSKWISIGAKVQLERAAKAAVTTTPTLQLASDAKKIGLENFGNTCYANSVLQALYFCTPFRDLLLRDVDVESAPVPQNNSPIISPVAHKPATPIVPQRWRPERKPSTPGQAAEPTTIASSPNAINPIPSSPPSLFAALQSLFLNISTNPGEKGTVSPRAFIDKLKELNPIFRSTMHQDAHEFLNYLLNQIMEDIGDDRKQAQSNGDDLSNSVATLGSKTPPTVLTATSSNSGTHPQDATLVHKLFEGVLTSETRCLTCETVSSRDEAFLDLSIDIEQNSSVTACLRQFSASEMLCQRNKFFCDSCCDLQEAEKRMKIKKLPNVLALHLKRFKYQEDVERYIKLAYRVAFPFELRLFNTVDDMDDADRLYNLFAIVVHIGNGPHHGHYVSIIKTVGTWLVFDDDNVYPIPESDITKYFGDSTSGSAYVLYYQAVDMDLSTLGLHTPDSQLPPEAFINSMPPLARSSGQNSHAPTLPPGLNNVNPGGIDLDQSQLPPSPFDDPSIPFLQSQPDRPIPILPPVTIPTPETNDLAPSPAFTSIGNSSPMPPTTFGTRILPNLGRAPSLSGTRGSAGSPSLPVIGNDTRKSLADRSPRPSISTPSFVTSLIGSTNDEVPPLPPLPPSAVNHIHPPITTTLALPSESEKDIKSKSPVGWFAKKRKSLRIGEKSSKPDSSPTRDIPTSPVLAEGPNQSHTSWFKPSTSNGGQAPLQPLRRPSENGTATLTGSASLQPETLSAQTLVSPAADVDARLDGNDDSYMPDSASSSPSSTSLLNSVQVSTNGSATSGPTLDFLPGRQSSLAPRSRNSVDHKKSVDLKAMLSSTLSPASSPPLASSSILSSTTRSPLTPRRAHGHQHSISNGHLFANGAEALLKSQSPSAESEGLATPVTGFGSRPLPNHPMSPPTSLAASVGGNNSTSSANSASSNFKRATRKLSITAPMLGFGRRDKDKDKEREKDKLREKTSPNASANRF